MRAALLVLVSCLAGAAHCLGWGLLRPGVPLQHRGLQRRGRSPPFQWTQRRGVTPTGDPGNRRTGAHGRGRGRARDQKRQNKNKNNSRQGSRREKSVSSRDWHFRRGGAGRPSPRGGRGAKAPRNWDPLLDSSFLFQEEEALPRARQAKRGNVEEVETLLDNFVIDENNQVLDTRPLLFGDLENDIVSEDEVFKAFDGDIGIADVKLSVEPDEETTTLEADSKSVLEPVSDPIEEGVRVEVKVDDQPDGEGTLIELERKEVAVTEEAKQRRKENKVKEKKPSKIDKKKNFPNNIRDVLRDFKFPSRFDEGDFPEKTSKSREEDSDQVITDNPISTEPTSFTDSPDIQTDVPNVQTDSLDIQTEGPDIQTEILDTRTDLPEIRTDTPELSAEITTFTNEIPIVTTDIPIDTTEKPIFTTNSPEETTELFDFFQNDLEDSGIYDEISNEISNDINAAIIDFSHPGSQKALLFRGGKKIEVAGGLDFSEAVFDESTGKRCIVKEEQRDTFQKVPILECTHKNVQTCHYTYITTFQPTPEEVCEENFDKQCSITFKQQAFNETVRKCLRPVRKVCEGEGPEVCNTVYESSCTTKYVEKAPGRLVADTGCEKLPVEVCGAGCSFQEGEETCHDSTVAAVINVPEEICDLNPQKTCRFVTRLVPRLEPRRECTAVPKETCQLSFSSPTPVKKAILTKWCLDESDLEPEEESQVEETARSGGGLEGTASAGLEEAASAGLEEGAKYKRNVFIRPRKPKYQTNFL